MTISYLLHFMTVVSVIFQFSRVIKSFHLQSTMSISNLNSMNIQSSFSAPTGVELSALKIGLTGSIGMGKSTIAKHFK